MFFSCIVSFLFQKIQLIFTSFTLSPHIDCVGDYLEIIDGTVSLGKFCGFVKPPPMNSASNSFVIHFKSDVNIPNFGFEFSWIFIGKRNLLVNSKYINSQLNEHRTIGLPLLSPQTSFQFCSLRRS